MLESVYQARLIKKIERTFRGCVVLKNDSSYIQGILDLTILYRDKWAMLEVKPHADADFQPNQEYYIDLLNQMSFAACIYPENEKEVLNALQSAFSSGRKARVS